MRTKTREPIWDPDPSSLAFGQEDEMQALVIDSRTRNLRAFVASVTQAQDDNPSQIVLRYALDMGTIRALLDPAGQEEQKGHWGGSEHVADQRLDVEMPVIIMGEYSAYSSAGHVSAVCAEEPSRSGTPNGYRKVLVVGGLGPAFGKGGLKVLARPISATLVRGPVEIRRLQGAGNSNGASADAAWAGVKMLANANRKSVFLVEGQSDYTDVFRLRSTGEEGEAAKAPTEHRHTMFSPENMVRRMVYGQSWKALARDRDEDDPKPSDEEVYAEATRRMERYLSAVAERRDSPWEWLGEDFDSLNMGEGVLFEVVREIRATAPDSRED